MEGSTRRKLRAAFGSWEKGLDSGLQLGPTKGASTSQASPHWTSTRFSPTGWKVRHDQNIALPGATFGPQDFWLRKRDKKLDRAERLMTQLVRIKSSSCFAFCLLWSTSIIMLARCPRRVFFFCASPKCRHSLRNCFWESLHSLAAFLALSSSASSIYNSLWPNTTTHTTPTYQVSLELHPIPWGRRTVGRRTQLTSFELARQHCTNRLATPPSHPLLQPGLTLRPVQPTLLGRFCDHAAVWPWRQGR